MLTLESPDASDHTDQAWVSELQGPSRKPIRGEFQDLKMREIIAWKQAPQVKQKFMFKQKMIPVT